VLRWGLGLRVVGGKRNEYARENPTSKKGDPVRANSVFRKLLAVTSLIVSGVLVQRDDQVLVLRVRPAWRRPRCSCCGRVAPYFDTRSEPRYWKILPWGRFVVLLQYRIRRVHCPVHGIRVEEVP
jgi:transposase